MEPEDRPYTPTITRLIVTDYQRGLDRLTNKFPSRIFMLDQDYRTRQFLPDDVCVQASRRERVLGCRLLVPHRPFKLYELRQWFRDEKMRPAMAEELVAFVLAYSFKRIEGPEYGDTLPWIAIGSMARYGDNMVVPTWRYERARVHDDFFPKLGLTQLSSIDQATYGFLGVHITHRSF